MESPSSVKQLSKAKQKNKLLSEKLSIQDQRCKHLEEQIRKSDEYSCNLQHKVPGEAWMLLLLTGFNREHCHGDYA